VRKQEEWVREYVAELRSLSEHCKFEATPETMLRDKLVVGINDHRI
jgi:hypothetical protein